MNTSVPIVQIKEAPNRRFPKLLRIIMLYIIAILFLFPFYIAIVYSIKTPVETAQSPLAFPTHIAWSNYSDAIAASNFFLALRNSVLTTIGTVLLTITVCSMAAYMIARNNNRFYNFFYYLFMSSIMLPFQVLMFPLYKTWTELHLLNTIPGLIIALTGVQIGYFAFLYVGFIKTVPRELEESATLDGASRYRTFFSIIFPLLKPINSTILVLSALGAWNDFVVSMIIVQKKEASTLPLVQFQFFGEYTSEINMAFAAIILSMIPIMVFYLFAQKYIIGGVTAGAVKG
ncbi:raffinose/stachyose/melibiose transport system permease protein [Paenibacillus sp. SORGH_AS306]|uniref:Carbohydrate ABC transporter permease n=1 Tax=Paenibacillus kyungheensis TaxID=1452732 RepID=A0AAX3M5T0_9BACL|nr:MULTISPECIES: carbohydrate ABC transporter permease [Paenibacillus]MDQ1232778.1 raffinose/stachyose/melibiose transport system permease protein [Paenibacillus sp. SORGH_AS_0306]MDR6109825.1 raffinose/stachyose/melibiose transport system permease protein [Paenibacillus sp. SORGH_AS_0338]WCT56811.1 carbohydrate ABC transporter permease [Paenibacillus kyungheensis]